MEEKTPVQTALGVFAERVAELGRLLEKEAV